MDPAARRRARRQAQIAARALRVARRAQARRAPAVRLPGLAESRRAVPARWVAEREAARVEAGAARRKEALPKRAPTHPEWTLERRELPRAAPASRASSATTS